MSAGLLATTELGGDEAKPWLAVEVLDKVEGWGLDPPVWVCSGLAGGGADRMKTKRPATAASTGSVTLSHSHVLLLLRAGCAFVVIRLLGAAAGCLPWADFRFGFIRYG